MERVLARHGELRHQRARRQRLLTGLGLAVLVVGGLGAWRAGGDPGGFKIGSGATVSSSTSGTAEPSSSSPGTVVPEHDIVIGTPVLAADGYWDLKLDYEHLTPGGTVPTTTTSTSAALIRPTSVERSAVPEAQSVIDRTLVLRFACAEVGGQGTIVEAVLGHIDGEIVINVQISSGGGPCASDDLGAELRVALPFDPGDDTKVNVERILRG